VVARGRVLFRHVFVVGCAHRRLVLVFGGIEIDVVGLTVERRCFYQGRPYIQVFVSILVRQTRVDASELRRYQSGGRIRGVIIINIFGIRRRS